ncbi:hypothetical protein [Cytobacillus kochii]|uniref:hypothetical protein n=1 Tax=Cytobacillus kochii TaxID=859143 RepID=UPI0025A19BB0|nr:hypothetical protein [Cytobacillus kochii]MDM5205388.1 hypothetical protein [Cytobacillus kochii]
MNKNDKKRKALISTLKGFRKNTPEKLYWVVDLQDGEDVRLLTLDEAKEHLGVASGKCGFTTLRKFPY